MLRAVSRFGIVTQADETKLPPKVIRRPVKAVWLWPEGKAISRYECTTQIAWVFI
jgi:hypothetical protein